MKIPTLRVAAERGPGEIDLNKIEILGEDINNLSVKRLAPGKIQTIFEGLLFSLQGGFIRKQAPKLLRAECNGCKHCQQVCPANAVIFENKKPRFDLDRCIRCFCCHELCPQRAITIDRGWRDILLKPFV
jgi:ferredoxin